MCCIQPYNHQFKDEDVGTQDPERLGRATSLTFFQVRRTPCSPEGGAAPRGPAAPQGPASTCWPGPRVPALGSAFSPGVPGTTNPSLAAQRLQEMRLGLEPHADGPLERARFLTVLNRW